MNCCPPKGPCRSGFQGTRCERRLLICQRKRSPSQVEGKAMTLKSVLITSLILGVLAAAACLPALDADCEIKRVETVVVSKEGASLQLNKEVVTTLSKEQQLRAAQISGGWLGTDLVLDGKRKGGWMHISDVTLPGALAAAPRAKPGAEAKEQRAAKSAKPILEPAREPKPTAAATVKPTGPDAGSRQKPDTATGPPPAVAPFDSKQAIQHQQTWAKHLKVPVQLTNSIGMKLTLIPPGELMMGSNDAAADDDEKPQHRVRITTPYYLGLHEVMLGQYRRFIEASGAEPRDGWTKANERLAPADDYPVVEISWPNAVFFCKWLSDKEGRTYRLPTEAEWEHACRAGTTGFYSFDERKEEVTDYVAGKTFPRTSPVGRRKPNPWALYDMHGNVFEWCLDNYKSYDNPNGTVQVDPIGTLPPSCDGGAYDSSAYRVVRGGARKYKSGGRTWSHCGSATRGRRNESSNFQSWDYMGLRLLLQLPGGPSSKPNPIRIWTVVDSSGSEWETTQVKFDCTPGSSWRKCSRIRPWKASKDEWLLLEKENYDINVCLFSDLISLQREGETNVVRLECRDRWHRKRTVKGRLVAGEFYGDAGVGRFRVDATKISRLSVKPPPDTDSDVAPGRPSYVLNLKTGDKIDAWAVYRVDEFFSRAGFVVGGETVFASYTDIRFVRDSAIETVDFKHLRRIALPGSGTVTLTLKDGSEVTGKLSQEKWAGLDGFRGEGLEGEFYVEACRVDSVEFLDR